MTTSDRWVVDANVVISAMIFAGSVPDQVIQHLFQEGTVLQSSDSLQEVIKTANREKFDKYVTSDDRAAFLRRFVLSCKLVKTDERITECRDPEDNRYLELAVAGQAAGIITGDEDLLVLHPFRGIAILTPAQYLAEHDS
ncbi:MAG: putative toxin-antitoxin system toxin component, PIN family [Gemmataceae bacterium]